MRKRIATFVVLTALFGATAFGTLDVLRSARADGAGQAAAASERTATFAVEKMTCGLCPVTVRKAMERVAGVRSVTIDFEAKTATVVFDSSAVSVRAIAAASADAGYPARPVGRHTP